MATDKSIPKAAKFVLGGSAGKEKPLSFAAKAALGMTAGACGALVGTPADVALIRMTGRHKS
ncbi:hypothetical protein OESDEN_06425 [Oesophagostomum dentatum]|uniref:Uncharacterized protein n=1 Tax=Oesophagostomum dentatum TaxID=61180 RepID=A0A0B1TE90_OESDE|nr:hypothetical protein OESDEN_06425 [Oesophagostomum dentatum]